MNEKLRMTLIILLIFFGSIILSIICAQLGGLIYSVLLNTNCTGGLLVFNIGSGCTIEGFIFFYIFWLAILSFSAFKNKTAWALFIIGTALFWLENILSILTERSNYIRNEYIVNFIVMLCFFAAGWFLAQRILLVQKKFKK